MSDFEKERLAVAEIFGGDAELLDISFDFGANAGGDANSNPLLDTYETSSQSPADKGIDLALNRQAILSLLEANRAKEASRMDLCGREFRIYKGATSGAYRSIPYHCGHRLCQRCQKRRVNRFWGRLKNAFEGMTAPKMLTLTVRNVPRIDRAYFKTLRGYFSKLRRRGCFKQVLGGVYSIETTYNKTRRDWHVHIHALIDSTGFINRDRLVEAWKEITDGSWGVDIRQADKDSIQEVLKYECKLVDFVADPWLVGQYLDAVKGARLFHSFGNVFDFEEESEEEADLKELENKTRERWEFVARIGRGDSFTDETGFVWDWGAAIFAAYGGET